MNDIFDFKCEQNVEWVVRVGIFSFFIGCKMMVDDVKFVGNNKEDINFKVFGVGSIFVKLMKIDFFFVLYMIVWIIQIQGKQVWGMSQEYKFVFIGLW